MGTRCSLTVYTKDQRSGLARLESFVRILESTEEELSTWKEESPLSRINQTPVDVPAAVSPSLCRLLRELHFWSQATQSAFDPAIGSLLEAWGLRQGGRIPSEKVLKAARARAGMRYIKFEPSECRVTREKEAILDSGAFGKGEALDRVFEDLKNPGAPWLIDLGGQVMVSGHPPHATFWTVGLAHPRHREQSLLTVELTSGSLSTSGGSEHDLRVQGQRIGHILDPRTGCLAPFNGSVTVWHARALIADILSTALYVMGPGEGLAWAEERNLAACFFVIAKKTNEAAEKVEIRATSAFAHRFPTIMRDVLEPVQGRK